MSKSSSPSASPAGRQRPCPALQQPITTSDCGAKRNSQISCPATCPYNPFGTESYDVYLQLEDRFSMKLMDRLKAWGRRDDFHRCLRQLGVNPQGEGMNIMQASLAVMEAMSSPRDARGRTGWEAWEADGWAGLNNDEKLMARHRRHAEGMILEIQEVMHDHGCWAIDVLSEDSQPFRVFDRSLARAALPYDRFMCVTSRMMHFTRPWGIVERIPWEFWHHFEAELQEWVEEERPSDPSMTCGRLIRQRFFQVQDLIQELATEWKRSLLQSVDLHLCVATYRLAADRAEIVGILRQKPDFEEQEEPQASPPFPRPLFHFRWLRRGDSHALEQQLPSSFQHPTTGERGWGVLGNVRVYEDQIVVDTMKRQYFEFAKTTIGHYFGDRLVLDRESQTDLAKQLLEQEERADAEEAYREAQESRSDPTRLVAFQLTYGRKHYSGPLQDLLVQHPQMRKRKDELEPESVNKGVLAEFEIVDPGAPSKAHLGMVTVLQDEVRVVCLGEERAEAVEALFRRCFGQELSLKERRDKDLRPWIEELTAREEAFQNALKRAQAQGAPLPKPEEFGLPEDYFSTGESGQDESAEQVHHTVSESAPPDEEAIPPEEKQRLLVEFHQSHYRRMLDDKIPMLRGHSPREAARDPSLRPLLVNWMKLHLNGLARRKREEGVDIDLDWMLDELRLPELKRGRPDAATDMPTSEG